MEPPPELETMPQSSTAVQELGTALHHLVTALTHHCTAILAPTSPKVSCTLLALFTGVHTMAAALFSPPERLKGGAFGHHRAPHSAHEHNGHSMVMPSHLGSGTPVPAHYNCRARHG